MRLQSIRPEAEACNFDSHLANLRRRRRERLELTIVVVLLDLAALATAYLAASIAYLKMIDIEQLVRLFAFLVPIFVFVSLSKNGFAAEAVVNAEKSIKRSIGALIWACLLVLIALFLLKISEDFSRALFLIATVLAAFLLTTSRMAVSQYAVHVLTEDPLANLYLCDGVKLAPHENRRAFDVQAVGVTPDARDSANLERLAEISLGLDGVIVYCSSERRAIWAVMLKALDVATEIVCEELEDLSPLGVRTRNGKVSLVLSRGTLPRGQMVVKRLFDLAVCLLILPFYLFVHLMIGALIKADSPGPILFRQERFGLGNRRFQILKFRTMRVDAQDLSAEKSTSRADDRVTRVGKFLRRTSLDELPQILNVIRGDMSIVGPRPHAEGTSINGSRLWEIDEAYWHRHVVPPGITGLAQIRGHRGSLFEQRQFDERLDADLEYAANWSLSRDLIIILKTLRVLVHKNAF